MRLFPIRCRPVLLLCLLSAPAVLGGCVGDCGFEPHCEGDTVMECEYGVDQLVGAGSPNIHPCLEPAPVCVERREEARSSSQDRFFCARSPLTPCDGSFVATCEGETLYVFCQGGWVVAEDCTNQAGRGRCVTSGVFTRCE